MAAAADFAVALGSVVNVSGEHLEVAARAVLVLQLFSVHVTKENHSER